MFNCRYEGHSPKPWKGHTIRKGAVISVAEDELDAFKALGPMSVVGRLQRPPPRETAKIAPAVDAQEASQDRAESKEAPEGAKPKGSSKAARRREVRARKGHSRKEDPSE